MLAGIFALKLSQAQIWLPLAAGMTVGALCIIAYRAFGKRPAALAPPPPPPAVKQEPEYDPFVYGSKTEQRKAHRRAGNPVEVLIAPNQSNNPEWRGWVVDRSVCGLCLCVSEEFADGTHLRALPINAPAMTPWTELEVRSCRSTNEGYELGCQFARQPPWSVLLLFG
jgi:hypothetical protein